MSIRFRRQKRSSNAHSETQRYGAVRIDSRHWRKQFETDQVRLIHVKHKEVWHFTPTGTSHQLNTNAATVIVRLIELVVKRDHASLLTCRRD